MGVEICDLTPASQTFEKSDFFSVEDYYFKEAIYSENSRDHIYKSNAEFNARHKHISKKADEETTLAKYDAGPQSKKSQTQGIHDNRAEERNQEREKNMWNFNESNSVGTPPIPNNDLKQSEKNQEDEHYEPATDYTDMLSALLNQQQKEKK